MNTLTIAFDTVIVGALALPWVFLIIHLFFLPGEKAIDAILDWAGEKQLQTVAGILLFAMTFTLGSAVSRMAQDVFNDDDLHIPGLFRMSLTEDRIVAYVYCSTDQAHLLKTEARSSVLDKKISRFECLRTSCDLARNSQNAPGVPVSAGVSAAPQSDCCAETDQGAAQSSAGNSGVVGKTADKPISVCDGLLNPWHQYRQVDPQHRKLYRSVENRLIDAAHDIFGLQESTLLLKGEDATFRLRQLHDQIMVLRGTTYSGLIAFTFCLFAWGVQVRLAKPWSIQHLVLALVPVFILFLGVIAIWDHYDGRAIEGPPYMEFSLLVVGLAGGVLLCIPWWMPQQNEQNEDEDQEGIHWNWPALSLVFAVLVTGGVLGWWATEVLYSQQVIYSYDSLIAAVSVAK